MLGTFEIVLCSADWLGGPDYSSGPSVQCGFLQARYAFSIFGMYVFAPCLLNLFWN